MFSKRTLNDCDRIALTFGPLLLAAVAAAQPLAADDVTLSIVGTNDLHGRLFTDDAGRGGLTVLGAASSTTCVRRARPTAAPCSCSTPAIRFRAA